MQLTNIKSLLEKYRNALATEEDRQEKILTILNTYANGSLTKNGFVIGRGIIKLYVNAVVKNELFMRKKEILEKLHGGGRTDIYDIQ